MTKTLNCLPVIPHSGITNEELSKLLKIGLSTLYQYKSINKLTQSPKRKGKKQGALINSWQVAYRIYRMKRWLDADRKIQQTLPKPRQKNYLERFVHLLSIESENRKKIKDNAKKVSYDLIAIDLQKRAGINVKADFYEFKKRAFSEIARQRKKIAELKRTATAS